MLPLVQDRFPECLFEDERLLKLPASQWWVIHTRSRQEKCLARYLHRARIPFYLPLIAKHYLERGGAISYVPLFAGYLFLLANRDQRLTAVSTSWVVQSVDVRDQEQMWGDLYRISRLILSRSQITLENQMGPGAVLEILSGPLAGLKGKIIQKASGRQFVVEVRSIQRNASVLLDDSIPVTVYQRPISKCPEAHGFLGV